jgi:multidrug transporter EmrE-like cation transporter
MNITTIFLVTICIALNVVAQLALKQGALVDVTHFNAANCLSTIWKLFSSGWVMLGGFFYVASVFFWLLVLNRLEVSKAYPLISIGYIVNAVGAYYLLGEHVTMMRVFGIITILTGVFIVARS